MVYGYIAVGVTVAVGLIAATGFRVVRPIERGIVERWGKYIRFAEPGLHYIVPMVDRMTKVDVTENMVDAGGQDIITKDKLNARVDAQIYFRVKLDEPSVKASQYNVANYHVQIVQLARTTLRNIIGTMTLNEANIGRNNINNDLMLTLQKETAGWGIDIVRAELKEINPPEDVQRTMNKVVIAENERQAAVDFATAAETKADGERRAAIKSAEGRATAVKIEANAKADAIKVVNEAAEKYFKGNAQKLKSLEVTQSSLENNSKIIITERGISPSIILGGEAVIPVKK